MEADASSAGKKHSIASSDSVTSSGVPKTIVNGHNGFLFATPAPDFQKPYLLEWLVGIHINGPRPPVMTTPNSCPPPDIPNGGV